MDTLAKKMTIEKSVLESTLKSIAPVIKAAEFNSRQFPEIYEAIGVDIKKLGCIMEDVEPMQVTALVEGGTDDLYMGEDYDDGAVGEKTAHVTLLFGLMENGNVWKEHVDKLLAGWTLNNVTIEEVSYFELPDSYCIIGLVQKTDALVEGHARLCLLPHMDTFLDYKPHVTMAYIKKDEAARNKWVSALNEQYAGQQLATTGLNYGDKPEDEATEE